MRAKARSVFKRLAQPYIRTGKDGVLELQAGDEIGPVRQFCIVVPIRDPRRGRADAVLGLIVCCDSLVEARRRHGRISPESYLLLRRP